ncbi:penicillin-binding transpeptidase domain-containing protein [Actinacidiphila sp. ITFR-21]|uniref:penicillin-binding transpeptidase domain-containing protein n=1 Tax=Actinacidiphila sp. ITFR-21 TaxID=3075199 RepID=UPI00288964DD|nr:penicillin-binding transpeptidase domain-containing protein [Streptomyces sp. ITFR-21]WNI15873.1 penicillin-binding transpeptidase domain-containing protein [Streptomyces sp. ITFR-21]
MSRGIKVGIIGTVFGGMLAVAGFGAYNIYSGLAGGGSGGGSGRTSTAAAPVNTAPPTLQEVSETATDFLTAWSARDTAGAAKLTDSPAAATAALDAYAGQAHITQVQIVPRPAAGTRMPFNVTATVSYPGLAPRPWTYSSSLGVGRDAHGRPAVTWAPSVLYPDLQDGDTVVTGPAKAPEVDVVDRDGKVLDAAHYPSLTEILKQLTSRYAGSLHAGTPGIETYIESSDGAQTKTLDILRKGADAKLRTTLDAGVQAAAEKAVKKATGLAGVTALDTGTGGILAVAFTPSTGLDRALMDLHAPGSTFKIVTAAALLTAGLKPGTSSPCHSGDNIGDGKPYTNVSPDNPDATLQWDFEQSCNTGFIKKAGYLRPDTLTDTAVTYFGLGPTWYVGTSTLDAVVPGGTGDELTSEMIGQGNVLMTPLNMASVAATVREGVFHQPTILQDSGVIEHRTQIPTTPLPPAVEQGLQQMMHGAVTEGTARPAMGGLPGKLGAKTGSAEAGTVQPNGWFTAYRGHVSAAGIVLQGGHGVDSAGPIVAAVLAAS